MEKRVNDWLDPKAAGKRTTRVDFERNREGIYGGLPQTRLDSKANCEDVTKADFDREKEIYIAQAVASGKPQHIAEKMVAGKMEKFYEEVCLLEQPFIKDQTVSIAQLIAAKIGKLGENISVRRFARFKVGDANATVASTTQKPDDGGEAAIPAAK